jgi:hypothetical protein
MEKRSKNVKKCKVSQDISKKQTKQIKQTKISQSDESEFS